MRPSHCMFHLLVVFAALLAGTASAQVEGGRDIFLENCASCHGNSAAGDGPVSSGIVGGVPDLTAITERNGGEFPTAETMSFIDGYIRPRTHSPAMPEFGDVLSSSPRVLYDTGDGILTPTPSALVALAEYLKSIQR